MLCLRRIQLLDPPRESDGRSDPEGWVAEHASTGMGAAEASDPGRLLARLDLGKGRGHRDPCFEHLIVGGAREPLCLAQGLHGFRTMAHFEQSSPALEANLRHT